MANTDQSVKRRKGFSALLATDSSLPTLIAQNTRGKETTILTQHKASPPPQKMSEKDKGLGLHHPPQLAKEGNGGYDLKTWP